jgi:hypothetical protein
VLVALKQMMDHKLLGVPVFDTKRKRYSSFIDIQVLLIEYMLFETAQTKEPLKCCCDHQDILCHALKVMNEAELKKCHSNKTSEFLNLIEHYKEFSEATCGQVANSSQRDIYIQGFYSLLSVSIYFYFYFIYLVQLTENVIPFTDCNSCVNMNVLIDIYIPLLIVLDVANLETVISVICDLGSLQR